MPDSIEPMSFSRSPRQSKSWRWRLIRLATTAFSAGSLVITRMPTMSFRVRNGSGNVSRGGPPGSSGSSVREIFSRKDSTVLVRPVTNNGVTSVPLSMARRLSRTSRVTNFRAGRTRSYSSTFSCTESRRLRSKRSQLLAMRPAYGAPPTPARTPRGRRGGALSGGATGPAAWDVLRGAARRPL